MVQNSVRKNACKTVQMLLNCSGCFEWEDVSRVSKCWRIKMLVDRAMSKKAIGNTQDNVS